MNNLEEMDKFFEQDNLLRLNQKETENMNRPTTSTEVETRIKNLQQTKIQDLTASQMNFIKHLEKN